MSDPRDPVIPDASVPDDLARWLDGQPDGPELARAWAVAASAVPRLPTPDRAAKAALFERLGALGERGTEAPAETPRDGPRRPAAADRSAVRASAPARLRRGVLALASAAALVVAVLGGVRVWNAQPLSVEAGAEVLTVTLPDGSEVALSPGSRIGYARGFGVRDVSLSGEAFFAVAHDAAHPFTVGTGEARVTVLGTRFSVRTWGETSVVVEQGRVRVAPIEARLGAPVVLTPGRRAVVGESVRTEAADVAAALAWRRAAFAVYDAPLGAVAVQIERAYGTPIRLAPGVDPQERVTALLPRADDAEAVVEDLAAGLGYRSVARAGGFDLYP